MIHINVSDYKAWRRKARECLKRGICAEEIDWLHQDQLQGSLLGQLDDSESILKRPITMPEPTLPRDFFNWAKLIACHRSDDRWALLYRLAWRLVYENNALLDNVVDPQVKRLTAMKKHITRDYHKMKAFVRFRNIDQSKKATEDSALIEETESLNAQREQYVAWFEPEHRIVELAAPFFVKRFNTMNWSILTPDGCAHWENESLYFTEGLAHAPKVEDEIESLWLQYYKSIFNPARLKIKAMQSEMPKKYWKNLPEAELIEPLIASANRRTERMISGDSS